VVELAETRPAVIVPVETSRTPTPLPPPIPIPAGDWLVVNKHRPLSADFVPADLVTVNVTHTNPPLLRAPAARAAEALFVAITAETGLELQALSAYRSFATQAEVHDRWVAELGPVAAEATSGRAGFSEHQLALALDVDALPSLGCSLQPCWNETAHAAWLAANAWRFGFIVRYPPNAQPITGFEPEPYHLRYVGAELAAQLRGRTLEEYFALEPAPDYLPTRQPSP
jgi:D-alanyl-D-alanine carboxypeptidase